MHGDWIHTDPLNLSGNILYPGQLMGKTVFILPVIHLACNQKQHRIMC